MRRVPQIFHIRPNQHFPEFGEIAVVLVLHLDDPPRVLPRPHHLTADLDELVGAHDGEGQQGVHGLVVLGDRLVVGRELINLHVVVGQLGHDLGLELGHLLLIDGVRLGHDGDDIDLGVEPLHAHQVDGLEAVAVGRDEVETDVNPGIVIRGQIPLDLQLLLQVELELPVDVVHDGLERVLLVDLVAVAHRVANGHFQLHRTLLQLVSRGLQLDLGLAVIGLFGLERRVEERVYERGLAQAGLADAEDVEVEAVLHGFVHQLIRQRIEPDVAAQRQIPHFVAVMAVGGGRVRGRGGVHRGGGLKFNETLYLITGLSPAKRAVLPYCSLRLIRSESFSSFLLPLSFAVGYLEVSQFWTKGGRGEK